MMNSDANDRIAVTELLALGAGYMIAPRKRAAQTTVDVVDVRVYPYVLVEGLYDPAEGEVAYHAIVHRVDLPPSLVGKNLMFCARCCFADRHIDGRVFASADYVDSDPEADQIMIYASIPNVDSLGDHVELAIGRLIQIEVLMIDSDGEIVGCMISEPVSVIGR